MLRTPASPLRLFMLNCELLMHRIFFRILFFRQVEASEAPLDPSTEKFRLKFDVFLRYIFKSSSQLNISNLACTNNLFLLSDNFSIGFFREKYLEFELIFAVLTSVHSLMSLVTVRYRTFSIRLYQCRRTVASERMGPLFLN